MGFRGRPGGEGDGSKRIRLCSAAASPDAEVL